MISARQLELNRIGKADGAEAQKSGWYTDAVAFFAPSAIVTNAGSLYFIGISGFRQGEWWTSSRSSKGAENLYKK